MSSSKLGESIEIAIDRAMYDALCEIDALALRPCEEGADHICPDIIRAITRRVISGPTES